MADLSITIAGVQFANPVFVASGTFGYGAESSELVELNRLGAIVTKSVTPEMRPGNPQPRIAETAAGMLNSIGLANVGLERFIDEKLPFLRGLDTRILVNVAGKTEEEYEAVVQRLEEEEGIDGYELNYSCPNVSEGGLEFSQNPRITERLTRRIRKCTGRLVIPKLTPNITDIRDIARAAEAGGADAISLINTVQGMAVDIQTFRPKLNTVIGGYSGPAIKPIAVAKVYQAAQAVKIPIIGIGGIRDWRDAVEFFLAGATAVQVGTANFIDPRTGVFIARELESFLERKKMSCISELIGAMKRP